MQMTYVHTAWALKSRNPDFLGGRVSDANHAYF